MDREDLIICSILVLYEPKNDDLQHICDYYDKVDFAYVIDNSQKNNFEAIKKEICEIGANKEKLKYYHFPENIGLCRAFNFAVSEAAKIECNWVLLMDSDSSFISDIIEVYKNTLKHIDSNKVAVLSPVHIYDRSSADKYLGIKDVTWAMTSGCLYNIEIFETIGGFMNELFVECLDIDYCYRAHEKGYRVVECGEALLKHFPAETRECKFFGKTLFKYGYAPPKRYRMQAKSITWLIRRYRKPKDVARYLSKWVKVLLFFDNKSEYIKCLRAGTREGLDLVKLKSKLK